MSYKYQNLFGNIFDKYDVMYLRIMSNYLNSCAEHEFDNIDHIKQNLHTVYNANELMAEYAISDSKFWTWMIPSERIIEFTLD